MLKHYLTVALRNLQRQKGYALINVLGLAIGIACCLLILLYVRYELSFDRYHDKAERLFRVTKEGVPHANVGAPWAEAFDRELPEVEHAVRFYQPYGSTLVAYGEKKFEDDVVLFGDANAFAVFSWPLAEGDPKTVLADPFTAVITEQTARKYFGKANPLGQTITLDNKRDYRITGVAKNIPANSHLRFDVLASMASITSMSQSGEWGTPLAWGIFQYTTYLLLTDPEAAPQVEEKIAGILRREFGPDYRPGYEVSLEPIADIHLYSDRPTGLDPGGNVAYVYLFSALAAVILLLAAVNFMNLATARSQRRAREVGMRKVLGAQRRQIAQQFLGESILTAFLALLLGVVLLELLLPIFNSISGKSLSVSLGNVGSLLLMLAGVTLAVGVLAGSYPALFLSSFRPLEVLRGHASGSSAAVLRKGLIVFQFTVSIVLLVSTLVISSQLTFLRSAALGFDKDLLIEIPFRGSEAIDQQADLFKRRLLQEPGVVQASISHSVPGQWLNSFAYVPEGKSQEEWVELFNVAVDHDFLTTYGVELLAGRTFSAERSGDSTAFVLTESAARAAGWTSPEAAIGKELEWVLPGLGFKGTVIGVVHDLNYQSLHTAAKPLVFNISRFGYAFLTARVTPDRISETLTRMRAVWEALEPAYPFEYAFVDEALAQQYMAEERMARLFAYCTGLALLVACMGLFGLASYTAEQRTKEIGVRKVLGAPVSSIIALLSKGFVRLILVSVVIAAPIAYYGMQNWLDDFAYHIGIGPGVFLLAGGLALFVALVTVSYQAIKAALANPVKSLRYE